MILQHEDGEKGKSTCEMENGIRMTLLVREGVREVSDVTIHYHDEMEVDVDVNIKLGRNAFGADQFKTVKQAGGLFKELRDHLMTEHPEIKNARLYLDLNDENDEEDDILEQRLTHSLSLPNEKRILSVGQSGVL